MPWLVDLERLNDRYNVAWRPGNQRADFIGRSPGGNWYAFEAKGRTGQATRQVINAWKAQARMVRSVNGRGVTNNIVSATFVDPCDFIHAIWQDPPSEDGVNLEFRENEFVDSYYEVPATLLHERGDSVQLEGEQVRYLRDLGIFIGIHSEVQEALQSRSVRALDSFAERNYSRPVERYFRDGEPFLFSDGLIIRLDDSWASE